MFELRKTTRDREQQLSMRRPHVDVEIRDMHADTGFAQPVEFVERSFERIGVAWAKDDGSLFVRLHGTQVIAGGFALYPVEEGGAR